MRCSPLGRYVAVHTRSFANDRKNSGRGCGRFDDILQIGSLASASSPPFRRLQRQVASIIRQRCDAKGLVYLPEKDVLGLNVVGFKAKMHADRAAAAKEAQGAALIPIRWKMDQTVTGTLMVCTHDASCLLQANDDQGGPRLSVDKEKVVDLAIAAAKRAGYACGGDEEEESVDRFLWESRFGPSAVDRLLAGTKTGHEGESERGASSSSASSSEGGDDADARDSGPLQAALAKNIGIALHRKEMQDKILKI